MDKLPFIEIDIEKAKDVQIEELKKFHKSYFEVENILSSASELKYMSELRNVIKNEFQSPTSEFVKFLSKKVYSGIITQKILDQFSDLVKRSISLYVNDIISDRLNVAIQSTENNEVKKENASENQIKDATENSSKIITTEEELEGFYIVKSILRKYIDSDRITYRDAQSYFSIFIDDNNRKPACRLYFNTSKKYIGIFTPEKSENKHLISSLDDIYTFQDELKNSILKYVETVQVIT